MGAATKPLVAGIKNYITAGLREVFGKKGKLKRTETAIITRQSNKAAKALNLTPAEAQKALRDAVKAPTPPKKKAGTFTPKKKNPLTKKDQGSTKGLTPKQKKERAKLIKEVKGEMAAANLPKSKVDKSRRRKTGPEGTPEKQKVQQGPLLSKVPPPEKVSKARRRQLVKTGQAKMGKGKGGKSVVKPTGEFAPPASIIAEEMGLKGRGKLPTAKEAEDFGLTVKKYGGKIKRNMGGPTTPNGPRSIKTYDNTKDAKTHMIRLMAKGQNASTIGDERGSTVVVRPGSLSKSQIESAKKTLNKRTSKPKKKTVFRRGGGQALRGFGKATYSNKMY